MQRETTSPHQEVRSMSYRQIGYEVRESIATITLDRPEQLNALTAHMAAELIDALDAADEDDGVRVVIVTGRGRAFCAGADLSAGNRTFQTSAAGDPESQIDPRDARDGGGLISLRIYDMKKPVLAAINGAAVGVGATMCLPMDVRLASTEARFGFVFARRGLVPEAASSWFLPRVVGISRAAEWVFTGRVFDVDEAARAGLVRAPVDPERLLAQARALAHEIAENASGVSVALARQLLWRMLGADHPMEAHKADTRGILAMGNSPDAREGIAAFLEKRPASFTMKVSSEVPDIFPGWLPRQFE